jgi:signal transduction histidine kinase/CheY-like chemotaxis protein
VTHEKRILVLARTGRDSELIIRLLREENFEAAACIDAAELCREIRVGAGAVLVTDESLDEWDRERLLATVEQQPQWSDLPLLVFSSNDRATEALISELGVCANATIFERPIRPSILICGIQAALRARSRQYETRDLLERLKQADQQKDLFLATLSHELRTPLTSIVGWIQLLKTRQLAPEVVTLAIETIERNTVAQTRLVEDILSVSRMVAGKLSIEHRPVRFEETVRAAAESVRPQAEARGIDLVESILGGGTIVGDAVRLQEVVWNLLSNSLKFTPGGGSIFIRMSSEPHALRLEVEDSGRGIEPEVLPHIFEHFRQADSSMTRSAGGLGLGLAIAKRIVELHGGTIEAASEGLNRGTRITVTLPAVDVSEERLPHEEPAELRNADSCLSGCAVLLVEDDSDSRRLLSYILRDFGASVTEATTVQDAIASFNAAKPTVIVSDIGLAGESGYDLIETIRQLEDGAAPTPAVAITGFADVASQARALASGFQLYIAKPVQPPDLIRAVLDVLKPVGR